MDMSTTTRPDEKEEREAIATIVNRSAMLQERLAEARRRDDLSTGEGEQTQKARDRLSRILDEVTDGEEGLQRLLSILEANREEFLWALEPNREVETVDTGWVSTFEAIREEARSSAPEIVEASGAVPERFIDRENPSPFEEFFIPFVRIARQLASEKIEGEIERIDASVRAKFERKLLLELRKLGAIPLHVRFSSFRSVQKLKGAFPAPAGDGQDELGANGVSEGGRYLYNRFIADYLTDEFLPFFEEYSCLARLLSEKVHQWAEMYGKFVHRFQNDWADVARTFGVDADAEIVEAEVGLSDPHRGGQTVLTVTTDSGRRIVYKPRSLKIEKQFRNLVRWANDHGAPIDLKAPQVIDEGTYGWVEYVPHDPCTDGEAARRYYLRAGALLCLLHASNGQDFHVENVIASGEYPVPVDLEILFAHQFDMLPEDRQRLYGYTEAKNVLNESVTRTALLPLESTVQRAEGVRYDRSALGGFGENFEYEVSAWEDVNTDEMSRVRKMKTDDNPRTNRPFTEEGRLDVKDYVEEVIDGFRDTYNFLRDNREQLLDEEGPLARFRSASCRHVVRNTEHYIRVLRAAKHPLYLREGVDRTIRLLILARPYIAFDYKERANGVFRTELDDLEHMDVPIFTAQVDGTDLHTTSGKVIEDYFPESGYERVRRLLEEFSEDDLQLQERLIRAALHARDQELDQHVPTGKETDVEFDELDPATVEESKSWVDRITGELRTTAHHSDEGTVSWISLTLDFDDNTYRVRGTDESWSWGVTGIALLFAARYSIEGNEEDRVFAKKTLRGLRRRLRHPGFAHHMKENDIDIGGVTGWASVAYTLHKIGKLLDAPDLVNDAYQVANLITEEVIEESRSCDVVTGLAGAALSLLTLRETTPGSELREKAVLCGEYLLDRRTESSTGHRVWEDQMGRIPTGFAHGASGNAYALARLYGATGRADFQDAALEAMDFVSKYYDPDHRNWELFEKGGFDSGRDSMHAWCNGSPGIGLAALGADALLDDDLGPTVERALGAVETYGLEGRDHLCCGTLGRIEFLLSASRRLDRPSLRDEALRRLKAVLNRGEDRGLLMPGMGEMSGDPGFWWGTSGMGYQLLRMYHPDELPNVLLME